MRGGADDEWGQAQSPDRRSGPRRHPAGRPPTGRVFLLEGSPGTGKTTIALQFLLEGAKRGRARPLRHPVRDRSMSCATARPSHGWDARRQDRRLRARAAREPARRRPAAEPALFLRPRARRDDAADLRGRRAHQGRPHRARQPVGDPPAGAELAALPPADPGAEALFRPARRDRAAARRPHHRRARQDRAQRRRTASSGWRSWRPTTAPSGGGCASSSIAARPSAAATTTSSSRPAASMSSRAWSRPSTASISSAHASAAASPAWTRSLGGGVERGSSTLLIGPAGTGKTLIALQFVAQAIARGEQGRAVHLRRGAGPSVRPRQAARASTSPPCRPAGVC